MANSAETVAIIGGGLSGICGARECLAAGLDVIVFERASKIGGQWSFEACSSGVFDNLTTNTTCTETSFSDVLPLRGRKDDSLGPHCSLHMTPGQYAEYIDHVIAISPGLRDCFHLGCTVKSVTPATLGCKSTTSYVIVWVQDEVEHSKVFEKVIIATGRSQEPHVPPITGIENFPGRVLHSKEYRNPSEFNGQNVLIVGGYLSGTECAGDLAEASEGNGPAKVTLCTRVPKRHVAKQSDDSAVSYVVFNNLSAIRIRSGTTSAREEFNKLFPSVAAKFGTNEMYNLPSLGEDAIALLVPQKFFDGMKKADKLSYKVGIVERVDETGRVYFRDGSHEVYDSVLFATGYKIHLPFLSAEIQEQLFAKDGQIPPKWLDLYLHTWHHALPGIGFLGMYEMIGAAIPPFEMQARWIARAFSDANEMPTEDETKLGIAKWIEKRTSPDFFPFELFHITSHEFAEKVGCSLDYGMYPEFAVSLLTGPFIPQQFRLFGHGARKDGAELYRKAAAMVGVDLSKKYLSNEEIAELLEAVHAFSASHQIPAGLETAVANVRSEVEEAE